MTVINSNPIDEKNSVYRGKLLFSLLAYGVVGWFVAAWICRTLGPMGVYDGSAQIILYGVIIVGTVPFVWVLRPLFGVRRSEMFAAAAIADMAALVCDGIAVAWFPSLYGTDPQMVADSAAAVLYGAGILLVVGFFLAGPDTD